MALAPLPLGTGQHFCQWPRGSSYSCVEGGEGGRVKPGHEPSGNSLALSQVGQAGPSSPLRAGTAPVLLQRHTEEALEEVGCAESRKAMRRPAPSKAGACSGNFHVRPVPSSPSPFVPDYTWAAPPHHKTQHGGVARGGSFPQAASSTWGPTGLLLR